MAVSITDRDPNYMKNMWGTNKLITDYQVDKRVLQEVVYDSEKELLEDNDINDFEYGIEPTYKLKSGQKVL